MYGGPTHDDVVYAGFTEQQLHRRKVCSFVAGTLYSAAAHARNIKDRLSGNGSSIVLVPNMDGCPSRTG